MQHQQQVNTGYKNLSIQHDGEVPGHQQERGIRYLC
jgi:hypothetical protein